MKIQKAFRNFKVQRTIEIQMATQDEKLTQEDAERFVDGNYIPGGRFDGKYQDFCLCRTEMRYRPLRKREILYDRLSKALTWYEHPDECASTKEEAAENLYRVVVDIQNAMARYEL